MSAPANDADQAMQDALASLFSLFSLAPGATEGGAMVSVFILRQAIGDDAAFIEKVNDLTGGKSDGQLKEQAASLIDKALDAGAEAVISGVEKEAPGLDDKARAHVCMRIMDSMKAQAERAYADAARAYEKHLTSELSKAGMLQ